MAFDGLFMRALREELSSHIADGIIDRIYQPARDTVVLSIYTRQGVKRLLISVRAQAPRVHITARQFKNPAHPPPFCMVLRKHLTGGRIDGIEQPGLERVFRFNIFTPHDPVKLRKALVVEIMGKHSNVVLVDPEGEKIIDGIKRYTSDVSRWREVLPGKPYIPPPPQNKLDPLDLSEEELEKKVGQFSPALRVEEFIWQAVSGFGPEVSREVIARSGFDTDLRVGEMGAYELACLARTVRDLTRKLVFGPWLPRVVFNDGSPAAFTAIEFQHYEGLRAVEYSSLSEAVDAYFSHLETKEVFTGRLRALSGVVEKELKKCYRKEEVIREALAKGEKAEEFRRAGELIIANLHLIKRGDKALVAADFYEPGSPPVEIPLDPELNPSQNAARMFEKYRKAKATYSRARETWAELQEEIQYLQSVLYELEEAKTLEDLEEIGAELTEAGYMGTAGRQQKKKAPALLSVVLEDGSRIYVGRNNVQNDYLLRRVAQDTDVWLHAKDVPGSHVIIKSPRPEVSEDTLYRAASLAAYFSRARYSSKVPVDYTQAKNVHRPKGSRPGKVLYTDYSTVYVTPDPAMIGGLLPGFATGMPRWHSGHESGG